MIAWAAEVRGFWLGLKPEQWWKPDESLDAEISERFGKLWAEQRQCPAETFLGSPEDALGAVILFDQFPRNMFRGHADSFATDHLALAIAKGALERGLDEGMSHDERVFLLMPFQHSESLADQRRSLVLFAALGDAEISSFARKHHDVIERFGRFPHRNAMLGRASTDEEKEFGLETPW